MKFERESLAFHQRDRGFRIKAWYLTGSSESLIQLFYKRKKIREFLYPSYKIWNLAAHFSDIVDGELSKDDKTRGYIIAGSDGLGGVVMPKSVK